jgi:hypothetical protein
MKKNNRNRSERAQAATGAENNLSNPEANITEKGSEKGNKNYQSEKRLYSLRCKSCLRTLPNLLQ